MHEIQDVLINGAQKLNTLAIIQLRENLPLIRAKMASEDIPGYPHLRAQSEFLAGFIEDTFDDVYQPADPISILEAAFALKYLFKEVDIIPDSVEGAGYSDDSAIIRAVLLRHRAEFEKFAKITGREFSVANVEA
ncbi:MAG: DUF1232 domain-containing protein [Chthoniobacterales bacterium]